MIVQVSRQVLVNNIEIPFCVFFYYIESIAINEEVKYYQCVKKIADKDEAINLSGLEDYKTWKSKKSYSSEEEKIQREAHMKLSWVGRTNNLFTYFSYIMMSLGFIDSFSGICGQLAQQQGLFEQIEKSRKMV